MSGAGALFAPHSARHWTTVSKNKDNQFFTFFSEYTRKHDTVSGNPDQRTLLTFARL